MAETYNLKKITEFAAKTALANTDLLLVGDNGASELKKVTFADLAAAIKSMYAINELQRDLVGSGTFDLNNITDGWHQLDATSAIVNVPVSGRQAGVVFQVSNTRGSGTKYQLYTHPNGADMWHRVYWYGTWSAWKQIFGRQGFTPTVGNGNIMSLGANTCHMDSIHMYVNCSVRFSGARSAGALLIRLPQTVSGTQYVIVLKNTGNNVYFSNVQAGTGDINCPVAFASGDIAYITGVILYG